MIKRLVIALILLALVGGGLVGFNLFRDRMIAQVFANMPVPPVTVSTVTAEPVVWEPSIDTIGTVNAARGVDLTVEAAGIVREILFESNATVEAGDLLLRLDDVVQRADLEAAETQLELDRLNLDRARELAERGVTANVSLDESQAAFQVSEAQVARARAVLDQRRLVAPFGGTIGLPRVDLGQYVSPGTSVATLQDLDTMRVDFSLPEQRLADIAIGQPLAASVEGLDRAFEGEITGIDPRVDPGSRLFAVRGAIDNEDNGLVPGQFVRIEIALPAEDGVIALPQNAVISSLYGDYVYVVRRDEDAAPQQAPTADAGQPEAPVEQPGDAAGQLVARQVFVEPGRRSEGVIEIRSGVEPGDVIVSSGQNRLTSGAPVVLDEDAPAPAVAGEAAGDLAQEAAIR